MTLPVSASACPYCESAVPTYLGRTDCPQCGRQVLNVPCPHCGRPSLNLTQLLRYGRISCFICRVEFDRLPMHVMDTPVAPRPTLPSSSSLRPTAPPTRLKNMPEMPTAEAARKALEETLRGLERVAQDRELLLAPDLRALISRFLDIVHGALQWDDLLLAGTIDDTWLHDSVNLQQTESACFTAFWPKEGALLPRRIQAWVLAVDDMARRWQYARRCWLQEQRDLVMMPIVAGVTTTNPTWHDIEAPGAVVSQVITPGFLLHGDVLRRATVRG